MIYLDNAATTSPKPQKVIRAVTNALVYLSANPGRSGHSTSENAAIVMYETRNKVAKLFNAPNAEGVIFTPNCTASINYVLKGLLKRGDRIVTSSLEHNAVIRPLTALKKYGIGFDVFEAASIGIIGGADGPTAILVTKTLAPHLLSAIAVAAYSYMALVPIIQPPIMRMLTTKKERAVVMEQLRPVSKKEKILFPIVVTIVIILIVPDAAPLVGMLMLGNLLNVSGVTDRLSKTAQNELINIVTIFLGISVGATANAENFLAPTTLYIIALGLTAFCISTCGGLIAGKIMYVLTKGKINPLIGSAGVSAVPMAARVSQTVGQKENPSNFLLMHAMGPNVAGVIGSAVAAGVFLSLNSAGLL